MVTALDQLRRMWRHMEWSDVLVLEALRVAGERVPDAMREYAHVIGAEEVWLARIERRPSHSAVWPSLTIEQVAVLGERVRHEYDQLLRGLSPESLTEEVRYTNSAGKSFVTRMDDILVHVALHGQYHRGKINLLLRSAGEEPAPVDFISFARGAAAATQQEAAGRVRTLILPGLYDSGPEHWQSRWERLDASCQRVKQRDWAEPVCDEWVATLDDVIRGSDTPVVLVSHSSSCIMVAHWAKDASAEQLAKVRGALIVAPSDPTGPAYPPGPSGFAPVPMHRLSFPSIVVASANDEYVSLETARAYADAWGSEFVNIGDMGHINGASGLGDWPFGYELLGRLRSGVANR